MLTVIYAYEAKAPKGRERIEWKLLTNLPVRTLCEAIEKLDWYALRWKIEIFHKILKSGCRAEQSQLRAAQRRTNLLAIYCILAWRIFWLCMINRAMPEGPASLVLTKTERQILDHVVPAQRTSSARGISHYLTSITRFGGYLARAHDPPPGKMVLWRGFARLTDIHLGLSIAAKLVGN